MTWLVLKRDLLYSQIISLRFERTFRRIAGDRMK